MMSTGTSSKFVAIRSTPSLSTPLEPPRYFPRLVCGEHCDAHQADGVIGTGVSFAVGEPHDLVAEDAGGAVGVGQRSLFQHLLTLLSRRRQT